MKIRILPMIAAAAIAAPAAAAERPRLVVQITFDQLRGDLLERYRPALRRGLKRVIDQGWWVRQGEAAHGLTVSWPGHGTLATGMYPTTTGSAPIEWWDKVGDQWTEIGAASDPKSRIVGRETAPGESPWRMEATSIGDWFKAASPAAKVIAIGSDAAIPYGGKRPDGTYWFEFGSGRFHQLRLIMPLHGRHGSTPSMRGLRLFRERGRLPCRDAGKPSRSTRNNARPSSRDGDAPVAGGGMLGPHVYRDSSGSHLSWLGSTPLADEELLEQRWRDRSRGRHGTRRRPRLSRTSRSVRPTASGTNMARSAWSSSTPCFGSTARLEPSLTISTGPSARTATQSPSAPIMARPTRPRINASTASPAPKSKRCWTESRSSQRATKATTHRSQAEIIAELQKAPFVGEVYTAERLARAAPGDWKAR